MVLMPCLMSASFCLGVQPHTSKTVLTSGHPWNTSNVFGSLGVGCSTRKSVASVGLLMIAAMVSLYALFVFSPVL